MVFRRALSGLGKTLWNGLTALGLMGAFWGAASSEVHASAAPAEKEWTVLVFLNGHNNLDSFGTADMLEMEKVGSTAKVNVVVQWASSAHPTTRRLLVQKSVEATRVTSPVVQDLPRVDMGDYRQLVEFVRWGVKNYPAKRYFIDVWNHGSGWRKSRQLSAKDISFDDFTGNAITTEQLGTAMREAARIIGKKVDLYGSDACLMGMIEVAAQMADSVDVFAGSQDLEPGAGWPYDAFLKKMNTVGVVEPEAVATALADEYLKSYQGGSQGKRDVTFSVFDLARVSDVSRAVQSLGKRLQSLSGFERSALKTVIGKSQKFYYPDYVDLVDFLIRAEKSPKLSQVRLANEVQALRKAVDSLVIANRVTQGFSNAHGVSIWIPESTSTWERYQDRYRQLEFARESEWDRTLESVVR